MSNVGNYFPRRFKTTKQNNRNKPENRHTRGRAKTSSGHKPHPGPLSCPNLNLVVVKRRGGGNILPFFDHNPRQTLMNILGTLYNRKVDIFF